MRRWLWSAVLLLGLAVPVWGAEDGAGPPSRKWHLGLQAAATWRDNFQVFGQADLPPKAVAKRGSGGGLIVGRLFGDRFLLDMQLVAASHEISRNATEVMDVEALITFSVLFRQTSILQPFIRGGFGAGGELLTLIQDSGHIFSFGTTAIAGGGLQVRLSRRFSLDFEAVSTFANFLEVMDESSGNLWPEDSWQVRASNWGWRCGAGVQVWF